MRQTRLMALTLMLAPGLAAQRPVDAQLAGRVPPSLAASVTALLDSAAVRGFPGTLLVDKTLEGVAKGAPAELILAAVRTEFGHLDQAARLLAETGTANADAVEAGAFALRAGLSGGDVAAIARTADRTYPAATALQVAGTLRALGVPRAETVGLVRATIRSVRPVSELVSLPGQVQAATAGGVPPAAAA
ncbi:MAG: hypothetical protein ACREJ4_00585, partial [Candidatus Methylomirabilaceae bacterium]